MTQTERSGDRSEPMQTTVGEIDTAEALQQAINVAPDGVQTDIILTDGFSIDTVITIPEGKEISFDLNGKTLTVTENFTGRPFKIEGALIVEGDGTIDTTSAKETYGVFDNYGVLTVLRHL